MGISVMRGEKIISRSNSKGGLFVDMPENTWERFKNSGSIEDYLAYKNTRMYNWFNPNFFDGDSPYKAQPIGGKERQEGDGISYNYEEVQKRIDKL